MATLRTARTQGKIRKTRIRKNPLRRSATTAVHRTLLERVERAESSSWGHSSYFAETVITVRTAEAFPPAIEQPSSRSPAYALANAAPIAAALTYAAVAARLVTKAKETSLKEHSAAKLALAWPFLALTSSKFRTELRTALRGYRSCSERASANFDSK
jgi:hypothetical protein